MWILDRYIIWQETSETFSITFSERRFPFIIMATYFKTKVLRKHAQKLMIWGNSEDLRFFLQEPRGSVLVGHRAPLACAQPLWARPARRWVSGVPRTPVSRIPRTPASHGGCCPFVGVFLLTVRGDRCLRVVDDRCCSSSQNCLLGCLLLP